MKWLFFLSVVILFSCSSNSSAHLSANQRELFTLSDNFKSEYREAPETTAREKVMSDYEMKLQQYLRHTCDSNLENIKVRMTKLEEDPMGRVYAEFTDRNCTYVFRQVYDSSNEMKADVVYRFVKSLKPNTEITLHFLYGGNVKINDPANTPLNSFEIEVIPTAMAG